MNTQRLLFSQDSTRYLIGSLLLSGIVFMMIYHTLSWAQETDIKKSDIQQGYTSKKESVRSFFEALSSTLNKPIIVSARAANRQISGNFDFQNPQGLLEQLTSQLSLMWYHDGQSIYIYDNSEIKNVIITLRYISLERFNAFLKRAGLYDRRFPLRGEAGTFYLSAPPIFVDLIINTIKLIDKPDDNDLGEQQKVAIVRLSNTFVGDRNYVLRDQKINTPGIATILKQILSGSQLPELEGKPKTEETPNEIPKFPNFPIGNIFPNKSSATTSKKLPTLEEVIRKRSTPSSSSDDIKIIAYPDTNSLLIKGTDTQIRFIKNLIAELDVAKRHVELSLWIIDLQKSDLDQLGVQWQGGVTVGNKLGISFNSGSLSTLDGSRFLASVSALSQNNKAQIVSRPLVLTQENIPALFDNNRTFYAKLTGQYTAQLDHVTYGTLINVLPRFTNDNEIEMVLDIEDGAQINDANGNPATVDTLPQVGRTHINTIARVPKGKSLLIGGYINDQKSNGLQKIPVLGSLPVIGHLFSYRSENISNLVRVFLIQPREIQEPLQPDASEFEQNVFGDSGRNLIQKRLYQYLKQERIENQSGQ